MDQGHRVRSTVGGEIAKRSQGQRFTVTFDDAIRTLTFTEKVVHSGVCCMAFHSATALVVRQ